MITSKERFQRILNHQPVDRIGLFEVFWRETAQKWSEQGHFADYETYRYFIEKGLELGTYK